MSLKGGGGSSSGSGGGGGSVTVQGAIGTNLGATQTIDFASTLKEIWLVGTLNANLTVTVSNRVAGCRAKLQLLQDGTGGRTLTVTDGVTPKTVTIASGVGAYSEVLIDLPDAANVNVAPVGGGIVTTVTAADGAVVVGGTATAPTITTGTLDVIAADHPPAANWSNNAKKITSLANGSGAQDAAAFGQIPTIIGQALSSQAFVDMCAAPYGATPGTDITTALQTAINAANTANQDTTLFFSKPGVYDINGALQSATVDAYTYNGQILFPARADSAGAIHIRIMGPTPAAVGPTGDSVEGPPAGGVVLLTNATSGWIFDAIPGNTFLYPHTDIHVTFQDICLRAPLNPQCGAINASALEGLKTAGSVQVDVNWSTYPPASLPSGGNTAIIWPPYDNAAFTHQSGELVVVGYTTGVQVDEHFTSDYLLLQSCATGMVVIGTPSGGVTPPPHLVCLNHLCLQGCQTGIAWAGTSGHRAIVKGLLDVGDLGGAPVAFKMTNLVSDASSNLFGKLEVHGWSTSFTGPMGFPVNGATNLKFVPLMNVPPSTPMDGFQRIGNTSGNFLGTTDLTHDVWSPFSGTFNAGGGSVKSTNGAAASYAVIQYRTGRARASRAVRAVVTPAGAGFNIFIFLGRVISGANNGNWAAVELFNDGHVYIVKNIGGTQTTLATGAAGALVAGTTYTVDVAISNPVSAGGLATISVYLNGSATATVTYTLSGTDAGQLSDTNLSDTEDGIGFFADTSSAVSWFAVMPN